MKPSLSKADYFIEGTKQLEVRQEALAANNNIRRYNTD